MDTGRQIVKVPLKKIKAITEHNCRGKINPQECVQLATRIRLEGLLNPIQLAKLAEPEGEYEYEIIAGFRRFVAHRINNAETIEAQILPDDTSEADKALINLTENMSRSDLSIIQEAKGVERLRRLRSMSPKELAETLNMSVKWVQIRIWALELEDVIQTDIQKGYIKTQHIEQLHALPAGEKRFQYVKQVKTAQLTKVIPRKSLAKKNVFSKRIRTRTEIFELQDHIINTLGAGIVSQLPEEARLILQALGWAAGESTEMDIYGILRKIANKYGLHYEVPEDSLAILQG